MSHPVRSFVLNAHTYTRVQYTKGKGPVMLERLSPCSNTVSGMITALEWICSSPAMMLVGPCNVQTRHGTLSGNRDCTSENKRT